MKRNKRNCRSLSAVVPVVSNSRKPSVSNRYKFRRSTISAGFHSVARHSYGLRSKSNHRSAAHGNVNSRTPPNKIRRHHNYAKEDENSEKFNANSIVLRIIFGNSNLMIQMSLEEYLNCLSNHDFSIFWRDQERVEKLSSSERYSKLKEGLDLFKAWRKLPLSEIRLLGEHLENSNISSLSLLVRDYRSKELVVACVCVFSIYTENEGYRSFCDLKLMCTKPGYERRGLGSYAIAVCKEFTRHNPSLKRTPVSSFIWCYVPLDFSDFFFDEKQGFETGWGELRKLVRDDACPSTFVNGAKVHYLISKDLRLGSYLKNSLAMDESPECYNYANNHRVRKQAYAPIAEFTPGSIVNVKYPKVSSSTRFDALVLDYNPRRGKPYLVQYEEGSCRESVVPMRIERMTSCESNLSIEFVIQRAIRAETLSLLRSTSIIPSHDLLLHSIEQMQTRRTERERNIQRSASNSSQATPADQDNHTEQKSSWSRRDDRKLIGNIRKITLSGEKLDWNEVARSMPTKNSYQCRDRWFTVGGRI